MNWRVRGGSKDREPIARWKAPGRVGWPWEAYEMEKDDLFYGWKMSPETEGQWEWGLFSRGHLEQVEAIRVDVSDDADQSDPGTKHPRSSDQCEIKFYEVELKAIY